MGISFVFLLFITYSVIGWICEEVYCSISERKLVNRGFLHGPICPVYGFGGLLVINVLQPFSDNIFVLFTMAVFLTSALEYVTSWVLEAIFSTRWWDYSPFRFNVHGRIWLPSSLVFGGMGVLAVQYVHPAILSALSQISPMSQDVLSEMILLVLVVDLVLTLKTLVNIDEKLVALKEFTESLRDRIDVIGWFNEYDLQESLEKLKETVSVDNSEALARLVSRFEKMLEHTNGMFRIFKAFPAMRSKNHNTQLDILKRLKRNGEKGRFAQQPGSLDDGNLVTGFAKGYGFYKLFLVFFAACFFGVILETLWCVFTLGHLESRAGLVYGMLNPVYGFGGLFMTLFFIRRQKSRDLRVFIDNMLIGGIFEYVCSLGQELVFGTISWEYSKMRFSINNRTNLLYIVLWGVIGLVWVREIYPALSRMIEQIPVRVGKILTFVLLVGMLADMGISGFAVYRWSERNRGIEAGRRVDVFLDKQYPDAIMRNIYPNMMFVEKKKS